MLTPRQKHLIKGFKMLGLDTETTVGIMSFLDTVSKRAAMEQFLVNEIKAGKRPTEQEILQELRRILGV